MIRKKTKVWRWAALFSVALAQLLFPVPSFSLEITSVWVGGDGFWENDNYWLPNGVPDNDAGASYSVFIDGGDPTSSTVYFSIDDPDFSISNLTIDQGDMLIQQDLSIFTVEGGDIINNGTLYASAPTGGATLIFTEDSIITGTGTMDFLGCLSYLITINGKEVTLGHLQKVKGPLNFLFEDGVFTNQGEIRQYGT
ncbi:hypothetical protein JW926_08435, partial [Candidatus Sumerlaeota bacterium]|nr:hypothetical protein [Candidatus Sumerlaeota bacterium]